MHPISVSIKKGLSVLCLLSLVPGLYARTASCPVSSDFQAGPAIPSSTQCFSSELSVKPSPFLFRSAADLSSLDNTIQNWGQGVQFNNSNQPVSSVDFQAKYNHLGADFIGPETENVIWLTFDEGYENGYTESILNTLKEKNCPAVFFVTGQYASENPELMKRMIAEGHAVGNHSWSHPAKGMPSLSVEDQKADLTKLHNYIREQYQYDMTLFRFPAGIFSEQSMAVAQSMGYRSLFWSFAYADWDPNKQPDKDQTLKKLCDRLHPGSLYLLHAVSATNAEILGDFIDQARNQGYEFKLP